MSSPQHLPESSDGTELPSEQPTPKVLIIGEPLVEFTTQEPLGEATSFTRGWGGDALITACALGKLTQPAETAFVSPLGQNPSPSVGDCDDSVGENLLASPANVAPPAIDCQVELLTGLATDPFTPGLMDLCRYHNVGLTHSVVKPSTNLGAYLVSNPRVGMSVGAPGINRIVYHRQGSAASQLGIGDIDGASVLSGVSMVVASGIGLAVSPSMRQVVQSLFKQARQQGITTVLDPNIRLSLWPGGVDEARQVLRATLADTDIVLPSMPDDTTSLLGLEDPEQCVAYFHTHMGAGPLPQRKSLVVLKAGKAGAYISLERGYRRQFQHVPTPVITQIRNTIGAGDTFNAGFIAGMLSQRSLVDCAQWGNALARLKIQHGQTTKGLPNAEQFFRAI